MQRRALRQEQRNASYPGGSRQPASGRLWHRKRDNILDELLVETRFSDTGRYCILATEWLNIERAAKQTPGDDGIGLEPGMQIDLRYCRLLVVNLQTHLDAKAQAAFLQDEIERLKIEKDQLIEDLIEANARNPH